MAEHERKCASPAQGPNFLLTHLGPGISLHGGLGVPLSLGSLTSVSSSSSLLSCPLSSLSLQDSKIAGPLPVPLGSLSNAWQASKPVEVGGVSNSPGVEGQGGSPSLAELIQEHQSSSPDLFSSLSGLKNLSTLTTNPVSNASTTKTQHNNFPSNAPSPFPSPLPPPPGFFATLSLSDLISQHQAPTLQLQNHASITPPTEQKPAQVKQPSQRRGPHTVDLSVLMSQGSPEPPTPRGDSRSPTSPCLSRGIAGVFAEPSMFALTMCVQMRKRRSLCRRAGHPALPYGKPKEGVQQVPALHPITPFSFDTPSPDDIVKANQKKAFTRE